MRWRSESRSFASLRGTGECVRPYASASGLFSGAGDGVTGFFVGGAAALGFAFVPELFAFGQSEFDFDFSVFEVHTGGD